jgi:CubicO group peptidase (beta-lactamase class C family)
MRRPFWLASPLLLFSLSPCCGGPFPEDAVDALLRESLKKWKVPGVAVAIVRDDRIVYLKGHGVKVTGGKAAVTPDTLFPLGSCTKAFTTTAMALLVDEGKMSWDDPVRKYLSYFHLSDPLADAQVRLRDLVTHRTGLASHDLLWYHAAWSPEEAVRRAGRLPLDRPFRTAFQYQTTMFTAAGLAVASAAKMPWDRFIEKRLFVPLGMTTAGCTTNTFKSEDRASGHRLNGRGEAEPLAEWYPLTEPEPAGSIHASARDLAQWLRFHLAEGKIGSKRLVTAANLRVTHTPQMVIRLEGESALHPDTNQMSYGMGWVIQDYRGRLLVSHAGVIDGFRVHITLLPREHLGFVILTNLYQTRMNLAASYKLVDLLLGIKGRDWDALTLREMDRQKKAAREELRKRLASRHQGTKPSLGLAAYAGIYEHPAYGKARVTLDRGRQRLVVRWSSFTLPLEHFHYDTFATHHDLIGHLLLTFELDAGGRPVRLVAGAPLKVTFKRSAP